MRKTQLFWYPNPTQTRVLLPESDSTEPDSTEPDPTQTQVLLPEPITSYLACLVTWYVNKYRCLKQKTRSIDGRCLINRI